MFRQPTPRRTPSTTYYFHCANCRRAIPVEPNQSGRKLDCGCGVTNVVPSLLQLQSTEASPPGPSPFGPPSGNAHSGSMPAPHAGTIPHHAPACPFCSRPMQAGRIIGERYQLKWLAAEIPLTMGIWAVGGTPIGHGGFMQFNRPHVYGWRCGSCGKIIVDERA